MRSIHAITVATGFCFAIVMMMALSIPASAAIVQVDVLADTYIRSDLSGQDSKNDADADNEIIVGRNGNTSEVLNGLIRFDLSDLLALGPAANLQINSVTLTGTTRTGHPGQGTDVTLNLYDYGFEFIEADATYNDPDGDGNGGTGDITPGGTQGTLLSSLITPTTGNGITGLTIVYTDSTAFRDALSNQLAGDGTLNLLLTGTGANTQSFLRFDDEDRPDPFFLTVDVTVIPEPSSILLLGLSSLLVLTRRRRA